MQNDLVPRDRFAWRCIQAGAWLMLLGVIVGAFGSHLLAPRLAPRQMSSFETGSLYHLVHAMGLVLVGLVARQGGLTRPLRAAATLMLTGIACFSGSIYLITLGAPRGLGAVAPIGGVAFMAAWVCLAVHARGALRSQVSGAT